MTKFLSSIGRFTLDDDEVIANGLSNFERELQNRGTLFFGGSKPGMLDLMIWPWCERAEILKIFGNGNLLKKDKYRRLVINLFILISPYRKYKIISVGVVPKNDHRSQR